MGILDLFRRRADPPPEKRAAGAGYTAQIMAARESFLSGTAGLAELTGTVQSCVSLWESAFAAADVAGTDLLTRARLAMIARTLALRGESVMLIRPGGLVPAADWDLTTREGVPRAYRLTLPDTGGGTSHTALAGEVLHLRLAADPVAPWAGTSPLRRASLTAGLLHELETALRDTYRDAPLGSQIIPLPDGAADDMAAMRESFRGRRGASLVVEGVAQATAGGFNPQLGQRVEQLSPNLEKTLAGESLEAARASIFMAYGVLPALANRATTGPVVREAQRHLATWALQPLAELLAEEATAKLGAPVAIDVMRPLQAYDAGGRARAVTALVKALAEAKAAGIDPEAVMRLVGWQQEDGQDAPG